MTRLRRSVSVRTVSVLGLALAGALALAGCGSGSEPIDDCPDDDCVEDCLGVPGGSATEDMCGVCDEDPSNDCVQDCAGEWGGEAVEDMCGVCDEDPGNDCVQDCAGEWGGEAVIDACGRCAGGSTGVEACPMASIVAAADSYVSVAAPSTNYGSADELEVDRDRSEIYLRFNLGSLPEDVAVHSATLRMVAFGGMDHGGDGTVYVEQVSTDTWQEYTITWNDKPSVVGDPLASWQLEYDGSAFEQQAAASSPELTMAVQIEANGDRMLSLRLRSPGYMTRYWSRELADPAKRPVLEIGYEEALVAELEPVADAWVSSAVPSGNYGSSQELRVDRGNAYTFMRFDLNALPENVQVHGATLTMTAYTGWAHGGDGNVYTRLVIDDSWAENTITWANRPDAITDSNLGYWFIWYGGGTSDQLGINSSPRLIPAIQEELDGDRLMSLRLNSPGYRTNYRSREYSNASQRPRMRIIYSLRP